MDNLNHWPELAVTVERMEAKRAAIRTDFEARTAGREVQRSALASEQIADAERFAREDSDLVRRIAAINFARGQSGNDPIIVSDSPDSPWSKKPTTEPAMRGTWRPEPPRGGGAAKSRRPRSARSLETMSGLRHLVIQSTIDAGEDGLTAYDLPALIEKQASGEVLERFLALKDKVKNAADGLYVAREAQHELGLVVERLNQRWRIRKALPHEVAPHA